MKTKGAPAKEERRECTFTTINILRRRDDARLNKNRLKRKMSLVKKKKKRNCWVELLLILRCESNCSVLK